MTSDPAPAHPTHPTIPLLSSGALPLHKPKWLSELRHTNPSPAAADSLCETEHCFSFLFQTAPTLRVLGTLALLAFPSLEPQPHSSPSPEFTPPSRFVHQQPSPSPPQWVFSRCVPRQCLGPGRRPLCTVDKQCSLTVTLHPGTQPARRRHLRYGPSSPRSEEMKLTMEQATTC